MKLAYTIQVYKSTVPIKFSVHILHAGLLKSFQIHYSLWKSKFLKQVSANLCCTEYNEINMLFRCTKASFV